MEGRHKHGEWQDKNLDTRGYNGGNFVPDTLAKMVDGYPPEIDVMALLAEAQKGNRAALEKLVCFNP